jgi:hypothetical protein
MGDRGFEPPLLSASNPAMSRENGLVTGCHLYPRIATFRHPDKGGDGARPPSGQPAGALLTRDRG